MRYVTEVTTPYVPPPPPRSAQNKSGYLCKFTVRYSPVDVTMFNSITLSTPGDLLVRLHQTAGTHPPRPYMGEIELCPPPKSHPPAAPTDPPAEAPPTKTRPWACTASYASCHCTPAPRVIAASWKFPLAGRQICSTGNKAHHYMSPWEERLRERMTRCRSCS